MGFRLSAIIFVCHYLVFPAPYPCKALIKKTRYNTKNANSNTCKKFYIIILVFLTMHYQNIARKITQTKHLTGKITMIFVQASEVHIPLVDHFLRILVKLLECWNFRWQPKTTMLSQYIIFIFTLFRFSFSFLKSVNYTITSIFFLLLNSENQLNIFHRF